MKSLFTSLLLFTSFMCSSQIQLKNDVDGKKIGIGMTNPKTHINIQGPVHLRGNLTVGSDSNGELRTRHIEGKRTPADYLGPLYLNWRSTHDIYAGRPLLGYRNNLRLAGSLIFEEFGGGFYMSDDRWIRIYGNKDFYHRSGRVVRIDGTIQVGAAGSRFVVAQNNRVGIMTGNPIFPLHVNGAAGKPGGGVWTNSSSDRRLKKNIVQFEDGLEKVVKINPVWYQYNGKAGIIDTDTKYVGIIAQEMQKVAPYTINEKLFQDTEEKISDDGKIEKKVLKEENFLTYDGSAVTYMLVNAVKELHAMIEDLKLENIELKERLNNMVNTTLDNDKSQKIALSNAEDKMTPVIFQNRPNPYKSKTIIDYFIPEHSSTAEIIFYDLNGKLIKEESISQFGTGSISIDGNDLISGSYLYTLFVDGVLISSNKMTVSK